MNAITQIITQQLGEPQLAQSLNGRCNETTANTAVQSGC